MIRWGMTCSTILPTSVYDHVYMTSIAWTLFMKQLKNIEG
jgi:hypothetical protein